MAIYLRRAIIGTGDPLYLQPNNLKVKTSLTLEVTIRAIPHAASGARSIVTYSNSPSRIIRVSGSCRQDTAAAGEAYMMQIMDALIDPATLKPIAVDFCNKVDSATSLTEIYRSCICTQAPDPNSERFLRYQEYEFVLTALDPVRYTSDSNGAVPPAGPYETYLPGGGGGNIVPVNLFYTIPFSFDGLLEATGAANKDRMQIKLRVMGPNNYMHVRRLVVAGAGALTGASGNTIIEASDAEWDGDGNALTATAAYNASYADSGDGDITIAKDGFIYIYVTSAAGGHSGLRGWIEVSSAAAS